MSARDVIKQYVRLAGDWWTAPKLHDERVEHVYQQVRAEVLTEEAAELKAHCLEHNRFAATGFADCPCRVADELLRRVKVAGRGA